MFFHIFSSLWNKISNKHSEHRFLIFLFFLHLSQEPLLSSQNKGFVHDKLYLESPAGSFMSLRCNVVHFEEILVDEKIEMLKKLNVRFPTEILTLGEWSRSQSIYAWSEKDLRVQWAQCGFSLESSVFVSLSRQWIKVFILKLSTNWVSKFHSKKKKPKCSSSCDPRARSVLLECQ